MPPSFELSAALVIVGTGAALNDVPAAMLSNLEQLGLIENVANRWTLTRGGEGVYSRILAGETIQIKPPNSAEFL
jgi:hypothetical protein